MLFPLSVAIFQKYFLWAVGFSLESCHWVVFNPLWEINMVMLLVTLLGAVMVDVLIISVDVANYGYCCDKLRVH